MEKKLSFICIHCKEKQTSLLHIQSADIISEDNLQGELNQIDAYYGELLQYECPNCRHMLKYTDLPQKILKYLGIL
jgi:uncharacterized UBP type Zn finger protein